MPELKPLFRGQIRCYGEKLKNFTGEKMESAWAYGPGVARGSGYHSIIYGEENGGDAEAVFSSKHVVCTDTLGVSSGKTDKKGTTIFTGDIIEFINSYDFDCYCVVKFGEYDQDGSGSEYPPSRCLGFYVEVENFTCPDYYGPDDFPKHLEQQSLLDVCDNCEVIGNVFDNPDLLEVVK